MEAGAYPSPLNYFNFPKSVCTSVNEVCVCGRGELTVCVCVCGGGGGAVNKVGGWGLVCVWGGSVMRCGGGRRF